MADAAELVIRIRDEGEYDRGNPNPPSPPPPAPAAGMAAGPTAGMAAGPTAGEIKDIIRRLASNPDVKKAGFDARTLAAMHPDFIRQMAEQVGVPHAPPPPPPPPAPPPPDAADVKAGAEKVRSQNDRLLGELAKELDDLAAEIERKRKAAFLAGGGPTVVTPGSATPVNEMLGGPTPDEAAYGRTKFAGDGPDAPLPSWMTDEQKADLPPPGPGYRLVPPGEKNANFIKRNIPKGVGSALESLGVDVGPAADAIGGAAASAGLTDLAAVAGPAAAALLLAEVAGRAEAAAINAATKGVQSLGTMAADVAGNNYLGAFATYTGAAADALEKIPIVGRVYAAEIRLATAAVTAYTKTVDAFVRRGQELARFNADIAGGVARANVRTTLADVRESQALGPALTRLIDKQSQAEANLRELLLPIKEMLAEFVAETAGVAKEVTGIAKEFAPVLRFFVQLSAAVPVTTMRLFRQVLELLHFWLKMQTDPLGLGEPSEGELNSMMNALFDSINRIPNPAAQPAPGRPGMPPLLGGI